MDRLAVFALFTWQYLLMAYVAGLGVIQLASARSLRRKLWLVPRRAATMWIGVLLVLVGVGTFFLEPLWIVGPWGTGGPGRAAWSTLVSARNVNDVDGGLAGYWQALYFSIGFFAAGLTARAAGRLHR